LIPRPCLFVGSSLAIDSFRSLVGAYFLLSALVHHLVILLAASMVPLALFLVGIHPPGEASPSLAAERQGTLFCDSG
ncbi:hypothetical protein U1Q18_008318, partial [Sarracenia purpurea var. burkii]